MRYSENFQRTTGMALALFCAAIASCPPAYASSKAAETAGAQLFRDKGCAYCHGGSATGTPKGPSLANVRKSLKPAQITDQIQNGGQKMPAFGDSLSQEEVTKLVLFLRAKHRPAIPPANQTTTPASPLSNPAQ